MHKREHGPECQYCDATEAFDAWVAIHDPDGELTLLEQIDAYGAIEQLCKQRIANMTIEQAAAEVLAAYREHQAMLLIGGHEPRRLNAAIDLLEQALEDARHPVLACIPPTS